MRALSEAHGHISDRYRISDDLFKQPRSLSRSATAVEATLVNTAANLLTTAAAGYLVFHETIPLR
jgi:hypothetical protein